MANYKVQLFVEHCSMMPFTDPDLSPAESHLH